MSIIFFNSHQSKSYKLEPWRHIFSQWYCSGKAFIGKKSIYDLSNFILDDDWNNLVLNKQFWLREQWMMYIKALIFAKGEYREINLNIAKQIIETNNPETIKALGRTVIGYSDLIWDQCKFQIVVNGNHLEEMKDILLATGNRRLCESSHKDRIWGIGFNEKDAQKTDQSKWGQSLLGNAIMEARHHL